jgi:hypothetical protein
MFYCFSCFQLCRREDGFTKLFSTAFHFVHAERYPIGFCLSCSIPSSVRQTMVMFNEISIPVDFLGCDEKQIPSLLSALKNNKITVNNVVNLSHIELYTSEAILHNRKGDRYRIPIF